MPQALPFSISLDLAVSGPGAVPRAAFDAALKQGEAGSPGCAARPGTRRSSF